jgi:hypothetical protein
VSKNLRDSLRNGSLNKGLISWRGISPNNNVSLSTNSIAISFDKIRMSLHTIFIPNELVFISPDPIGIAIDSIVVATNIIVLSVNFILFTVDDFVVGSVQNVRLDDLAVGEKQGRYGEKAHFFNHFACFACLEILWME